MSIIRTLFLEQPLVIFPTDWPGWAGLLIWLGLIIYAISALGGYQKKWDRKNKIIFFVLFIFTPITSMVLGVRLPTGDLRPMPALVLAPKGPAVMFLSAIPWILAAGLLGPVQGVILAALSGVFLAVWDTHSIFTPIEMALLALSFSTLVGQRYRTYFFKGLRNPILAGFLLSVVYPLVFWFDTILLTRGDLAGQMDYASIRLLSATLAVGGPILIAGISAQVVKYAYPSNWGGQPPWKLGPAESSLTAKFLRISLPLSLIVLIALIWGGWSIVGNAAKTIMSGRIESAAKISAESVPHFLDVGQTAILRIADNLESVLDTPDELGEVLQREILVIPYFHQIYLLGPDGTPISGYPDTDYFSATTNPDEILGIEQALNGMLIQIYALPPGDEDSNVQLSFLASILDDEDVSQGVLVGRTELQTNPFAQGIISSLNSLYDIGGTGFLIDEYDTIIYHPDHSRLMQTYSAESDGTDGNAPDGTRQITHQESAVGRPWAVIMTLPAHEFQDLAIDIAAPLLAMVFVFSSLIIISITLGLRAVTASLRGLAVETDRISKGDLDHSLHSDGVDEIGQLSRSFEKMRLSLKARLDELNRLLFVSQGIASSLNMEDSVRPILESGLAIGASSARIVLADEVIPDTSSDSEMPSRFGLGDSTHAYGELDDQILSLMENQDRIVLTNPGRTTLLHFRKGMLRPESLLAVALHHEDQYYGTMWVGYDVPHAFSHEEVRFLKTLAGQAVLAATNNHLFWSAEFGRQQLAAILASTPDPVIVTDYRDHLMLVNPAACQALDLDINAVERKPIRSVIAQRKLVEFIRSSTEDENQSVEIELSDGRYYLATVSSIHVDNAPIGQVCVLRDITHFKELSALKSEFVATVSHDLRSPLTLVRGYATMMGMVGDLSKQQEEYARKIIVGVERMSQLITNLLDLGRIEADIGLHLETLPIRDVLEAVREALVMKANQKRIKLHLETAQLTELLIEADHALLQQAFQNLLENAIKYSPDGRNIWIRSKSRNGSIVFEFQDEGIGVSPVDKPRLFEKFYRSASRTTKMESGSGLGLAIVKSIAERHGGRVWFDSQLGKGSTFYFEIPLQYPK